MKRYSALLYCSALKISKCISPHDIQRRLNPRLGKSNMDHVAKQQRKVHPRDKNSILSNRFFLYTIELYKKGFKKDLEENDLYDVPKNYRSKKLGDQLEKEWNNQKKNQKPLSVARLLVKCYGFPYLCLGSLLFFMDTAQAIVDPYALGRLISYFSPGQTEVTKQDACCYAAFLIGFNLFQRVYKHNYILEFTLMGIKVRTALCSFLYRKALKLSPAHFGNVSVGKIVTLITKDVQSVVNFADFGNDLWVPVIKGIIVAYVLYKRIGVAAIAGVTSIFILMQIQVYLGLKTTNMKIKMCERSDERLQVTQETLSAIRIIRMYTWENTFLDRILKARKDEVRINFKIFALRSIIWAVSSLNTWIAFYIILNLYIWLENEVTAEIVYFMLRTFGQVTDGLTIFFPTGLCYAAELKAAFIRIGNIVRGEELQPQKIKNDATTNLHKISFKNVTVSIKERQILKNINVAIEDGLTLITGPVGSGKSFFLKTILQDYEPEEGNIKVQGQISYASQEPWLFPSSIRQNILFGEKYDEIRYQEVLKVCALIYDFELLEHGDGTIVEDRGINLSKGQQARINLARAIYRNSDIYLLDDPLAALDTHVSAYVFKECILKFLKNKLVIFVTHNINYLKNADKVIIFNNGEIETNKESSEFNINDISKILTDNDNKKLLPSSDNNSEEDLIDEETKLITEPIEKKVYQEYKQSGKVKWEVYKKYIRLGGGFIAISLVFSLFIAGRLSMGYTDKLISKWVNLEEKIYNSTAPNSTVTDNEELIQQRTSFFYFYTAMTIITTIAAFGKEFAVLFFTRIASVRLHKKMIVNVANAAMSFFDTNFIGNILNRFSKDLVTVDEMVSMVCGSIFAELLKLISIVVLIASVNTIFLIPTAFFLTFMVILRRCALPTSRSLKRLDALTRSPVVGHLNATLEGLTTIRAFEAEKILKDEFDRHQDLYTSAAYSLYSSMEAFSFTLDVVSGFFIAAIVIRFLIIDSDTLSGDVGLALTQAFGLTFSLQWGIRQWAELENLMTSVERALEYTEIQQENKQGLVLEDWPERGEIKYENVYLTYTNSNTQVLKNINFTVKPQEKIGIIGRTGAGKSSIISTLFRLYEVEGKISIDGVDLKTLSLDFLRSKISIIPQDPILFSGTVRENIDPTKKYKDEEIWKVVETANLKDFIPSLDFDIVDGGSNFSIGQRQLICLARAVIQRNKIIVLDEATSNMDPETEALIQETIKENFKTCTLLVIAHKLHSVLNSDKIMVLDKGEIIEYGTPKMLLENKDGIFYKMMKTA